MINSPVNVSASPQVLVLELETRLQKERERLGELRKKHYELAGVAEGWGEDEEGGHPRYNLCTVLKKTVATKTLKICLLLVLHRHRLIPATGVVTPLLLNPEDRLLSASFYL